LHSADELIFKLAFFAPEPMPTIQSSIVAFSLIFGLHVAKVQAVGNGLGANPKSLVTI